MTCYLKGTRACYNCEQYGKCEDFKKPLFNLYVNGTRVNQKSMTIEETTKMQIHIMKQYEKYEKMYKMTKPKFEIIGA